MICSSFLQVTRERTSERRVIIYIYIYKSSLDRPDGCIITIIVERESETRVEPFCSWTSREIVNRVTSAHFTRMITCLSPDYDLFSIFLRRHSLYPLFQFLYPLLFSSYTPLRGIVDCGWTWFHGGCLIGLCDYSDDQWFNTIINNGYWNLFNRYKL